MNILTKFGLVACLAGAAMLITGSLPRDKMEKIYSVLGGKPTENQPPLRVQLLVGGAAILFIGLVMLGLIHPPAFGTGQVDTPTRKERPSPHRPSR